MNPTQLLTSALENAYIQGIDDFIEAGPRIGGSKGFAAKARTFAETKTAEVIAGTREFMRENGLSAPKEEEEVDDGFSFSLPLPGNRRFVLRVLEKLWSSFRQLDPQGLADLQGIDPMAFLEACGESHDPRIQRNLAGFRRFKNMIDPLPKDDFSEAAAAAQ
jgi:hypothetical protein